SGSHCDVRNGWLHGFSGTALTWPVAECQMSESTFLCKSVIFTTRLAIIRIHLHSSKRTLPKSQLSPKEHFFRKGGRSLRRAAGLGRARTSGERISIPHSKPTMRNTMLRKQSAFVFAIGLAALAPLFCGSTAHAQATRTWVSGVGDDVNPCSRTAPCKTFAGAISKTAPSGIIN